MPPHSSFSNDSCLVLQYAPHSRTATLLWTFPFPLYVATLSLAYPSFYSPPGPMSGMFFSKHVPRESPSSLLTSSLNLPMLALSSNSLLLTLSCHLTFIILLRHRFWNKSLFLALSWFVFHVLQPYSKTGLTSDLYSLIFVFLVTPLEINPHFV